MTKSGLTIAGGVVKITDLVDDTYILDGLVATGVTFEGPAIITFAPGDHVIDGCKWLSGLGGFDSLLWEVEAGRTHITGVVGLTNATLIDCTFSGIGVAGTASALHTFAQTIESVPND